MRIEINDNPVRWFKESHRIRVADTVLNEHFAGTYDAFVVLTADVEASLVGFRDQALAVLDGLDEAGADGVSLIITGGLRTSSDIVKALAMGADAVPVWATDWSWLRVAV